MVPDADDRRLRYLAGRQHQRRLKARIRIVRESLADARYWIDAGLDGRIALEEAACSADSALWPAVREVLQAEMS